MFIGGNLMKKFITMLLIISAVSVFAFETTSKDSLLLNEGFENNFPPLDWTSVPGAGCVGFQHGLSSNGFTPHTGDAFLLHYYMEDGTVEDDWIWTSEVTLPADGICTLYFWHSGNWISCYIPDFEALHEVVVSDDGGTTWSQLFEGPPVADPSDPFGDQGMWTEVVRGLKDYAGKTVKIGFHYHGIYSTEWYIDDVQILYDYEGPQVISLIGNEALHTEEGIIGAYLNNDMILNLRVADQSGVASVTGHYSFDGEPVTDLVFNKAKDTELWTGTIPSRSTESAGIIYFDLVDIGGVASPTTIDYIIQFVNDTDPPIINSFSYGFPVFIEQDMVLTLTFSDESSVSNCTGYFSKTNWADSTEVIMTLSKSHLYSYTGTLPAETEQTFGKVKFKVTDICGNKIITNEYNVIWIDGSIIFFDNFEAGLSNWNLTGNWGLEEGTFISATHSLTESPDSLYTSNNSSSATFAYNIDLSNDYPYGYSSANIKFWTKYDLEQEFDYMCFEASGDNGMTWNRLKKWTGEGIDWHEETIDLSMYIGNYHVKFRWLFVSDNAQEVNGMNIDDIKVSATYDPSPPPGPVIIHEGPELYGSVLAEHSSFAQVYDFSGVDSVWVVYMIDFADTYHIISATYTGSDTWEFTIPAYEAGTFIEYFIRAIDSSEDHFESNSEMYFYRTGYHLNYTNGTEYIDYLNIIGPAAGNTTAVAERLTMGPMGKNGEIYKADLVGFTIANYTSLDYPCDPLYAHVWKSEDGKPGKDLIEPIYMVQGSTLLYPYALTYVDLRPYSEILSNIEGDIFVGFTSAGDVTNVLYEVCALHDSIPGYIDFNRSWLGVGSGDEIDWVFDDLDNYSITGITSAYTWVGVEDDNLPTVTELKQNYPNPFNPVTTIKFDLAKDSKVSLKVYDVMGREVAKLVDKEMVRGSHNVNFDASRLVSGVYYYTFKAGDVNKTRKMMLLK